MAKRKLFIPLFIVLGLLFVALVFYGSYHSWLASVPPEQDIAMHRQWANTVFALALADLLVISAVVVFRKKLNF